MKDEYAVLQGKRFLIVDDNHADRSFLEDMLSQWNIATQSAEQGAAVLDRIRAAHAEGHPYDLIVLDVQMPKMEGFAIAECLRAEPDFRDLEVLFLTSFGARLEGGEKESSPHSTYMQKPIKQSVLLEQLLRIFSPDLAQYGESPAPGSQVPERRRFRGRVLVVDGDPASRDFAIALLECHCGDVIGAGSGQEALDVLQEKAFDLILMDVEMPDLDGWEVTRRIRADERRSRTPVIGMSTQAAKGDWEKWQAAGIDDFLAKPVEADAMFTIVEKWRGHKSGELPGEAAA
jgi:CheY-like chemotaxis protein